MESVEIRVVQDSAVAPFRRAKRPSTTGKAYEMMTRERALSLPVSFLHHLRSEWVVPEGRLEQIHLKVTGLHYLT